MNRITEDTYKLWYENIAWMIDGAIEGEQKDIAQDILDYLQDEGAFTLIEDKEYRRR